MLSKFIYNDCFKKIPYTGNVYELHPKGELRNTYTKKTARRHTGDDGIVRVTTDTGEWFDDYPLSVLLAIVHRNTNLPFRLLAQLEVIYKDGKLSNFGLYNTVWKSPLGKLMHPDFSGFCYIPGYSRYLIDKDGQLLSPTKGELLSPYSDQNGYLMFGVQPDVGPRTIVGQHRLLALAWLEYPGNVDKLDVNHIDTNKSNNQLDNLEWATRSRNNYHAHENGLSNSTPVKVRDIITNEVTTYYSRQEAGRRLDLDGETIRQRIENGKDGRVYSGLQFKNGDDETPWVIEENLSDYRQAVVGKKVSVSSKSRHVDQTFPSITKAAQFLGMRPATLLYHLKRSDDFEISDYKVSVL